MRRFLILAIFCAAVPYAGGHGYAQAAPPTPVSSSLPSQVVELRAVPQAVSAEAVIEAARQATIAAQVAGKIIDLRVDAGQAVRAGQLLLRLEARAAAESVVAARATHANARAHYERTLGLQQQKFVSQAAVDQARAEVDAARAALDAAQAGQNHATLVAPFAGLVAERYVNTGDLATPGRPLLTIYEPGSLRAVANVPQSQAVALRSARQAVVEFRESGVRVDGARVTVLPAADAGTHTLAVRVDLPATLNGLPLAIVPGMAVRIHFVTGEVRRLTVPEPAIVRRGAVTGVYVLAPDGKMGLRQLRLGEPQITGEIEVLAGLRAGERIVLDPVRAAMALRQGAR